MKILLFAISAAAVILCGCQRTDRLEQAAQEMRGLSDDQLLKLHARIGWELHTRDFSFPFYNYRRSCWEAERYQRVDYQSNSVGEITAWRTDRQSPGTIYRWGEHTVTVVTQDAVLPPIPMTFTDGLRKYEWQTNFLTAQWRLRSIEP